MANPTVGLDTPSVLFKIGGKEVLLVGEAGSITLPPSGDPRFRFLYKEGPSTPAIALGTVDQAMKALQDAFTVTGPSGNPLLQANNFQNQLDAFMKEVQKVPFFNTISYEVGQTSVEITELGAALLPIGDDVAAEVRFGLRFRHAADARPRLFNIELAGFGATIWAKLTVKKAEIAGLFRGA